jgi:hypothetical protein
MAKTFFKTRDLEKMSNALLHNKIVLYLIFILTIANLFSMVFVRDLSSVAVFIASGLLTSFFSKNMVVIMVVSMVVANIFRIGNGRDGFETKKKEDTFANAMEELTNAIDDLEKFANEDSDEDDSDDEDSDDEDSPSTNKQ